MCPCANELFASFSAMRFFFFVICALVFNFFLGFILFILWRAFNIFTFVHEHAWDCEQYFNLIYTTTVWQKNLLHLPLVPTVDEEAKQNAAAAAVHGGQEMFNPKACHRRAPQPTYLTYLLLHATPLLILLYIYVYNIPIYSTYYYYIIKDTMSWLSNVPSSSVVAPRMHLKCIIAYYAKSIYRYILCIWRVVVVAPFIV